MSTETAQRHPLLPEVVTQEIHDEAAIDVVLLAANFYEQMNHGENPEAVAGANHLLAAALGRYQAIRLASELPELNKERGYEAIARVCGKTPEEIKKLNEEPQAPVNLIITP